MPNPTYDHSFLVGLGIKPVEIEEPATVPAESYDALLRAHQYLAEQMAPLYRERRDLEQQRNGWRALTIMIGACIVGQLIAKWVLPK